MAAVSSPLEPGWQAVSFCLSLSVSLSVSLSLCTDHSALLVGEVNPNGATRLGVWDLAVVGGAALVGEALDHGGREAGALKHRVLHAKAVAKGLPRSLEVLH